jgi:hypothetical protein
MRITVLTVPDCPNAQVIEERIASALAGRSADVELVEVADEGQAARLGMTGSPTVLVEGVDPFGVPGAQASVSCRLYRGPDGTVDGAPSVAELRRALGATDADGECECPPAGTVGRGGRGRLAPVVYLGQRSCTGPDAEVACGGLNCFAGRHTAWRWIVQHPDFTGQVPPGPRRGAGPLRVRLPAGRL